MAAISPAALASLGELVERLRQIAAMGLKVPTVALWFPDSPEKDAPALCAQVSQGRTPLASNEAGYLGIPLTQGDDARPAVLYAQAASSREWSEADQAFLSEIGNLLLHEIAQQQLLQSSRQRTAPGTQAMALLDSTREGIYGLDLNGNCTFINPAGAQALGYAPGELLGRNMHYLIHHTHRDGSPYLEEECPITHIFQTGEGMRLDNELLWRRDGTPFPVEYWASPILEHGEICGAAVSFIDVTERKEREATLREQADTIQTINEIGRLLSGELELQRLVQVLTERATALTGAQFGAFFYNVTDADGESYTLYTIAGVPAEAFSRFPMPRNTHLFGPTFRGEGIIRSANIREDRRYGQNPPYHGMPPGHLPVTSYLAVPVISRSGEVMGGLFFGHVKEGVFSERDEQLMVGLAAQTAIAMDNARLYQEAQQAIQAREEFLSVAAHELRTPVTSLRGFTQMLLRRLDKGRSWEPERLYKSLQMIDQQSEKLSNLILQLLDIRRLEAGQLTLEKSLTDLAALVRSVTATMQLGTQRHHLRVAAPDSVQVLVDPLRLEQALMNLLDNAIKYSPEGGPITVELAPAGEGWLWLAVTDQGIGIAPEKVPQIFERFYRAHGNNYVSGMGLGLYITRQIIELHGGTIQVESGTTGGSRFIVTLPIGIGTEVTLA